MLNLIFHVVIVFRVGVAFAFHLPLASHAPAQMAAGKRDDSEMRSCIRGYSNKLNGVRRGLGDDVIRRFGNVSFNDVGAKAIPQTSIVLGAGYGTTGTRSLDTALRLMGLQGEHYGPTGQRFARLLGYQARPKIFPRDATCKNTLERQFPHEFKYDKQYLVDTPVAELFLDLYWTFPDAKVILTTRPAREWAARRLVHHSVPAPIQEPCGYLQGHFKKNLAKLFDYHNDLVRCVVPKERLFELNFWEDSWDRLRSLGEDLASFVGGEAIAQVPGTKVLRTVSANGTQVCAATDSIVKAVRSMISLAPPAVGDFAMEMFPPGESLETHRASQERIGTLAVPRQHIGTLMRLAAEVDCELELVDDASD